MVHGSTHVSRAARLAEWLLYMARLCALEACARRCGVEDRMRQIHATSGGSDGTWNIYAQPRNERPPMHYKRVACLMHIAALRGVSGVSGFSSYSEA